MNFSRKPELSDFPLMTYSEPKRIPLKDCNVSEKEYPLWFKYEAPEVATFLGFGIGILICVCIIAGGGMSGYDGIGVIIEGLFGGALIGAIVFGIVFVAHGILRHSVVAGYARVAYQNKKYEEELAIYHKLVREAPSKREAQYQAALAQWEQHQQLLRDQHNAEIKRQQQEQEETARMREWEKSFREKIQREELAADERMSQSKLVHEIAQCILPTFKQIVESVDTEAHMKVRVRLALEVRADTIDYYNAADPQSRSRFVFKEEGIAEKLSPILRKALCKALVTELRLLILEAFPIDPERKMVQADLEGPVVLKSNVTYVPGRDYTAPEYDANSHACAVILYQASKDKGERHF